MGDKKSLSLIEIGLISFRSVCDLDLEVWPLWPWPQTWLVTNFDRGFLGWWQIISESFMEIGLIIIRSLCNLDLNLWPLNVRLSSGQWLITCQISLKSLKYFFRYFGHSYLTFELSLTLTSDLTKHKFLLRITWVMIDNLWKFHENRPDFIFFSMWP